MNRAAQAPVSLWLDENWRLLWITPLAVALWLGLLAIFAHLLSLTAPPPPPTSAVEARIVEVPPAAAGLRGGPAKPAPAAPKPQPRVIHRGAPHVAPHHEPRRMPAPPRPPSIEGTAKTASAPSPPKSAQPAATSAGPEPAPTAAASPGSGPGSGGAGPGGDSTGARALYAPTPEIPDDLREDAVSAVAVAHFEVGVDGRAQVTLTQSTTNPRIDEILLDTLKQWRFAPATRNGVAIESQFDIRIPVTVQ